MLPSGLTFGTFGFWQPLHWKRLLAYPLTHSASRPHLGASCFSFSLDRFCFHSAGESSFGHVLTAEVLRTYAHISFSYDVHDITMTDVNTVYRQILQALTSRSQYQISIHIPHPKIGNDSLPRPLSQHAPGRTCPLPQQKPRQ